MGEIEGMYTCPLCGKIHQNDSLCPVVLDRMKKTKYNTQSFLMGSILLECLDRRINFFQILKEVAYCMETISPLKWGHYFYFNVDFIISYFASVLDCSPSLFYKKIPALSEKYYKIIEHADGELFEISCSTDKDNNINDINIPITEGKGAFWEMMDLFSLGTHQPKLYIHKIYNGRKPSYHLRLYYDWSSERIKKQESENTNKKKAKGDIVIFDYMHFANLSLSESEIVSGFDLYAEKEGKLKDFFESFLEDNYSWEEIASQISCSYSVAYDWVSKLENATKKGLLLWEVVDRKQYVLYSTTYEKTEVKMYIVYEMIQERWDFGRHFRNHGDHILIYENERRIFHYGNIDYHDYDTSDDNNPEIIQEPMIRRLGVTIGKWNANWKRKSSL